MNAVVRRGTVVVLLVVSAACGSSRPTSPSGTSQNPSPPLIEFPPFSGPSRTFIVDSELTHELRRTLPGFRLSTSDLTTKSRFVLYDNGAFELQYPPSRFGDGRFRGAYQTANGVIGFLFEFQGRSEDTAWHDATGTLKDDSLTVLYDEMMRQADFEDAVYTRE